MSEKESMKAKEQETPPQTSHLKKQQGRYTSEKEKGPEKNNADNSNLPQTEDKTVSTKFAIKDIAIRRVLQ